jgi:hypothetical protein
MDGVVNFVLPMATPNNGELFGHYDKTLIFIMVFSKHFQLCSVIACSELYILCILHKLWMPLSKGLFPVAK